MPNRPKKKKSNITVFMHPIDDMDLYIKSLGTTMLDILEKKYGSELIAASMEYIQNKIANKQ